MDDIADLFHPGKRVGRFEIIRSLHQGGQATVYLARLVQPDQMSWQTLEQRLRRRGATATLIEQQKLCVLKVAYADQIDHLRNEWDYLSIPQVKHERLIKTFSQRFPGIFSTQPRRPSDMAFIEMKDKTGASVQVPYIALAYESGGSLKQELERRKHQPLLPGCAVQIAIQVGEALQHLHEHVRLVHHDISPSNIVLRENTTFFGQRKPDAILIDLAATDSLDHPRLKHIYGKRGYLPPERRRPSAKNSPHVDIYSLGMVLYELLVGHLPDVTTTSGTSAGGRHVLQPVREHNRRVSAELNDLVMQAIERDPALRERYIPDMRHMLDRLKSMPEAKQPCTLGRNRSILASGSMVGWFAVLLLIVVVLLGAVSVANGMIGGVSPVATAMPTVTAIPSPTVTITSVPTTRAPTSTPAGLPNRSSSMPVTPTMAR